jgi:hypothetical protein
MVEMLRRSPAVAHAQATATYMVSSGLAEKGYTYVNIDEGWNLGRDPKTNKLVEDKKVSTVPRTTCCLPKIS